MAGAGSLILAVMAIAGRSPDKVFGKPGGHMLKKVPRRLHVPGSSAVMIGDNPAMDGFAAQEAHIRFIEVGGRVGRTVANLTFTETELFQRAVAPLCRENIAGQLDGIQGFRLSFGCQSLIENVDHHHLCDAAKKRFHAILGFLRCREQEDSAILLQWRLAIIVDANGFCASLADNGGRDNRLARAARMADRDGCDAWARESHTDSLSMRIDHALGRNAKPEKTTDCVLCNRCSVAHAKKLQPACRRN